MSMAEPILAIAQPGEVEFCTLGMFILGMLIFSLDAPRPRCSQCIAAQMTLSSVVPGQLSRIYLEVQLHLLSLVLAWSQDLPMHDLLVGLSMLAPTFHPRHWLLSSPGAPIVSSERTMADLQLGHGTDIIQMRSEVG
jgi:hypothetical protein